MRNEKLGMRNPGPLRGYFSNWGIVQFKNTITQELNFFSSIVLCNSFYDLFVDLPITISSGGRKYMDKVVAKQLFDTICKSSSIVRLSSVRGEAFLIYEDDTNGIIIGSYSYGSSQLIKRFRPKFIIKYIAPRKYGYLDLTSINEVSYRDKGNYFSFGLGVIGNAAVGDIFTFNEIGVSMSRTNVIDLANYHYEDGCLFNRNHIMEYDISLNSESDCIYRVSIYSREIGGYLREQHTSFEGRLDVTGRKYISASYNVENISLK
jgi:hypothetical protein